MYYQTSRKVLESGMQNINIPCSSQLNFESSRFQDVGLLSLKKKKEVSWVRPSGAHFGFTSSGSTYLRVRKERHCDEVAQYHSVEHHPMALRKLVCCWATTASSLLRMQFYFLWERNAVWHELKRFPLTSCFAVHWNCDFATGTSCRSTRPNVQCYVRVFAICTRTMALSVGLQSYLFCMLRTHALQRSSYIPLIM